MDRSSPAEEPALRRLHNEDWGFDSNCFVCEPRNAGGLRIPFFHDLGRDVVVARFDLDHRFSGAPTYVHGGVTLAVLDEAMAWAAIAVAGKLAVTTATSTRFDRPVLVGREYLVEARVVSQTADEIATAAEVSYAPGKVCAEAEATFAVLGAAQAARATGADAGTIDPSMLKDPPA